MNKVGITGGIGSGKTTVCKMFDALGIPIYYADTEAKRLMVEDELLRNEIIVLLGKEACTNNTLNRKHIAAIVFNDKSKLAALNNLVHPAVAKDAKRWFDELPESTPFAIKEAALLHESGSYKSMDKVITVIAPEETRIQRVISRDGVTKKQVLDRMKNQWSDEKRKQHTDYIIDNSGDEFLISQVLELYETISGIELENIKPRYPKT